MTMSFEEVGLYQILKSIYIAEETTNEKETCKVGKILANHISDKKFIFKIFNKLLQFNSKRTNSPI